MYVQGPADELIYTGCIWTGSFEAAEKHIFLILLYGVNDT